LVHQIQPALTLSFLYLSVWSRYIRSSMLGVLSQEYVRTARAKGLAERRVLVRHALRNALMPLVTLIGLELPRLISGALVIEVIFAWPGVGRFAYERALAYDYTAVMGVTTFVAAMVVLGSILADFAYGVIDPRITIR
jgi:peptide/nickel transport system permease protein